MAPSGGRGLLLRGTGEGEAEDSELLQSSPASSPVARAVSRGAAVKWIALREHPVFGGQRDANAVFRHNPTTAKVSSASNLAAWDAPSSRLYLWDSSERCLHRLSVRFGDSDGLASAEAAFPSEILVPESQINQVIHHVSLNQEGSSVLLAGSGCLWIMYTYDRISSSANTTVCRTVAVGKQKLLFQDDLTILQASWHPYSFTHLGVLSSDSVFRIYDISSDLEQAEQEYFLQPVEPGRCQNAASIRPVAFYFGGEHLWDIFTVFTLFGDGSIYILCPIVPFGSVFSLSFIKEIYEDATGFGETLSNSKAVNNCRLAIDWLEATFPELIDQGKEKLNLPVLRAHPYVPADASISLQGPLRRVFNNGEAEDSEAWGTYCEGRVVAFLYNSIGKDSVLVVAWDSGQLQIDALADEVQPLWNVGISPCLGVDSHDHLTGFAMICEPNAPEAYSMQFLRGTASNNVAETVWLGTPPPLLRLSVMDLALPKEALSHQLSLFPDPILSEKIYCLHGGGIDLIILHFLPFSSLDPGTDEPARAPSVYPILSACHDGTRSAPFYGFVGIADSFGDSQVILVTSTFECILVELKSWKSMVPLSVDISEKPKRLEDVDVPDIISKELLSGPKLVVLPNLTSLRFQSPDSIEGRSTLHHYVKLFHENYVEYAHKVYVELKHHANHTKGILNEQQSRLQAINQLLGRFEDNEPQLNRRLDRAVEVYKLLEQRLQSFKDLPRANAKPLSKSEREFNAQLERFKNVELGALRSSVEALNLRLRRCLLPSAGSTTARPRQIQSRSHARISQLRSSVEKLSRVNDASVNKIKLIEQTLLCEGMDR